MWIKSLLRECKKSLGEILPLPGIDDIEQIDVVKSLLNPEKANVDSITFA